MRVKGFTRAGGAVVNTDTAKLDLIKEKRAQKKRQDQARSEIDRLREMILDLQGRVERLERDRG